MLDSASCLKTAGEVAGLVHEHRIGRMQTRTRREVIAFKVGILPNSLLGHTQFGFWGLVICGSVGWKSFNGNAEINRVRLYAENDILAKAKAAFGSTSLAERHLMRHTYSLLA